MDRYQRVEKLKGETPINENEIRITTATGYITYATTLLQEKGSNEILLKAMGRAINKTVMIAELIKTRIQVLHQNTSIESTDITDLWEPLEEGLLSLETMRHVSMIIITLSMKELDTFSTGYQPPLRVDQINDFGDEAKGSPRRGEGGGENYNGPRNYNGDGGRGFIRGRASGRGRSFKGRGRGGYGGQGGYSDLNDDASSSVPVRGKSAGVVGGRGMGQRQGFYTRSDGIVQATVA